MLDDLGGRHLAAGRHRGRGHHQHLRVRRRATGSSRSPTRSRRALALGIAVGRIGDLIIGDHLGQADQLAPGVALRGRHHRAAVHLRRRAVPGRAAGRPSPDDRPDGSQAARREGSGDRHGRGRPSDGPLRHAASPRLLFAVPVVRDDGKPRREGILTLTFGLCTGCCAARRGLAAHRQAVLRAVTGSQWTALTVATVCVAILIWCARRGRRPDPRRRRARRAIGPLPRSRRRRRAGELDEPAA